MADRIVLGIDPGSPSATGPGTHGWCLLVHRPGKRALFQAAAHAVRSGDSHGGGSSVNLSESD